MAAGLRRRKRKRGNQQQRQRAAMETHPHIDTGTAVDSEWADHL
jgi:hypothetical protein